MEAPFSNTENFSGNSNGTVGVRSAKNCFDSFHIVLNYCWLSFLVLLITIWFIWFLTEPRLRDLSSIASTSFAVVLVVGTIILFSGLTLLTITTLSDRDFLYPHIPFEVTLPILLPIAAALSKIFGNGKDVFRGSFIRFNNRLFLAQRNRFNLSRILVLLPHCLQIDVCNRKVAGKADNCRRCGGCPVGGLLDLGDRYRLRIEIANGGTAARMVLKTFMPDSIIAVACERDLAAGIRDAHPIPVYGIINDRPNGPCFNTSVDMNDVENAIKMMTIDFRS